MLGQLRKPNLFVVGAMKCGTTAFHSFLAGHPDIFMCEPKEPSYFVEPDRLKQLWPEMWANRYWEDESRYLALFAAAQGERFLGESSTNYSKRPLVDGVAERLRAFNPHSVFFYLIRNPIDRAISHYWHEVVAGTEKRPIGEAVTDESEYVFVGDYARQLEPFIGEFGRERVHVLEAEDLGQRPQATMRAAFAWLGVDADVLPTDLGKRVHARPLVLDRDPDNRSLLYRALRADMLNPLKRLFPASMRTELRVRLFGAVRPKEVPDSEVRARLSDIFEPRIDELEQLLDRDLSAWRSAA